MTVNFRQVAAFLCMLGIPALAGSAANLDALVGKAEPWPAKITIRHTDHVTKALYLETAEQFPAIAKRNCDAWLAKSTPYPDIRFHIGNASWMAREYQLTGDESWALTAIKALEHAHRLVTEPQADLANTTPDWDTVRSLYWIDKWLQSYPPYTDQQRRWVRDICLKACPAFPEKQVEYGAFNRPFGAALCGEALLALVPDAPDAERWRAYKETVWNYWWQFRDIDESTDHYNALWFRYLLDWVEIRGNQQEFWSDPGVKRMMERYLYYMMPMGAFPNFSDSCGWNVSWGHWVYIYEACATAYHDGRFKWAAHRLYDYSTNRIENIQSWAYTGDEAAWSLVKAYLIADDAIPEQPLDKQVVLLQRHKAVQRSEEERLKTGHFFDLLPEMAPDKLVFNSGSSSDGLAMLVDLVGDAGHSHAKRPALLALADDQSVLAMSLGYMDRLPEDHNVPVLADYIGYPYDNTEYFIKNQNSQVQNVIAEDLGAAGYGAIMLSKYQGYPATMLREYVFIKDVGVLVKDTLTMTVDLKMRWGSIYRVRNLGPDYGPNWANTYLGEWIPLRGIGKNSKVLTRWHNSPRDLLVYFLPNASGTLEAVDESDSDTTNPLPLRLTYTLRQPVKANSPVCTTSLLLPHTPSSGATLAKGVKVLLDDPQRTVLLFNTPDGLSHLIALNRSGTAITTGNLQTDARVVYIRRKGEQVVGVAKSGGTQLRLGNQDLLLLAPSAVVSKVPAD